MRRAGRNALQAIAAALLVGGAVLALHSGARRTVAPAAAAARPDPMLAASSPALPTALDRLLTSGVSSRSASGPVTVGAHGNEPVVAVAPDGTLYISALQHLYRSTDLGATWQELPGPIYTQQINLNSDSSLAVDPGGRLYFTFDWPYAGSTAVCTSDDKGDTWTCNPTVVPGGTDRMWVLAPTNSAAYEVTNEGLYQTAFLTSGDRGLTWVPTQFGNQQLEPQTGPLLKLCGSPHVLQPIKVFGNGDVEMYVFTPTVGGTTLLSDIRPTPLGLPNALPSATFDTNGTLYAVSEEPNAAGGRQVVVARSSDEGQTWTKLPPIPGTTSGTATFTWIAAGLPGWVGVVYYQTPANGDPTTLAGATWSAMWAQTMTATTPSPGWSVATLESNVHVGPICAAAGCMGTDRFAGDFLGAEFSFPGWDVSWMKQQNGTGPISIRFQQIPNPPVGPSQPRVPTTGCPTAVRSALAGRVASRTGAGVPGVRVALAGSARRETALTGRDGSFRFSGLEPAGPYVVTPRKSGYRFEPASRTVTLGRAHMLRFVARPA